MTDIVAKSVRSRMMSGIRGKDTEPERKVRQFLHAHGLRFRIHDRRLPGTPDLVLRKYRAAVFVHGCFWHRHEGCQFAYNPQSNLAFWNAKFRGNVQRDIVNERLLTDAGWRVHVIWECEIDNPTMLEALCQDITLVRTSLTDRALDISVESAKRLQLIENLGSFLKFRRTELGLTQESVAHSAKVEQTVVSKIERGVYRPGPAIARRIAVALRLPENALFRA